jgi:hypothetical protein
MRLRDLMFWNAMPRVLRRIVRNYMVASVLSVVLAIGFVGVRGPLGVRAPWRKAVPMVLGFLPLCVFLPVSWLMARRVRKDYIESKGRLCTVCAYNVESMGETGLCPECGERFDAAADAETWGTVGLWVKGGGGRKAAPPIIPPPRP